MKLIFVATTFMLHGIASAKIAQMLCNNKPPLSQWGPADDDSANEDQLSSYTASLTSSVIDYPIENGRRYHAYRAGSYFMPNDQNEMDRLDYAHLVTTKILGDKLYVAPIEEKNIHQVLDIGTGTGLWAIDFADRFPAAEVHGIDLSAIQPEWAPPNVKFEIDDVESPWVDRTYDFINCHWMMGSIQDWPKLISNCYKNLNPGGWAEFLEMGGEYSSDDGSFTHDHATYKWIKTLFDGIASTGRDSRPGTKLKGWVENVGFENITYKKVKVPLGVWPKDPYYKEMGFLNLTNLLDGLEAFTLRIFCGVLGFTKEETMLQLAEVRKELKDKRSFNAYYEVHIVCGQKPAESAE
ncbi:Secondary metabolism regulator LAE1 [Colletotrichum sp. SAR11_57]|nr:Secondary metabolism regulator LAE1 [Colletotrichum sp. SAR11_57]